MLAINFGRSRGGGVREVPKKNQRFFLALSVLRTPPATPLAKFQINLFLAGVVGLEPTTYGFGDRYSTIEPHPYVKLYHFIQISPVCQSNIQI